MRIVHLSQWDVTGGAARAAYRLHQGLQRIGQESQMLVAAKSSDDPAVIQFKVPGDLPSLVWRRLRRGWIARDFRKYRTSRPAGYELFSDDRSEYGSTLLAQIPECDVINLHWVSGMVDYEAFFSRIPASKPVVWTLHDMNPFTGGCHYDMGCGHYVTRCHACPQLGSVRERDLACRIWRRKQRVFSSVPPSRLHIVAPSRWLGEEAGRSSLFRNFSVSVVPYGLDLEAFAPRDQGGIRSLLGIPADARVALFVADGLDNRRKGFALLVEALNHCAAMVPGLMLMSLGPKPPQVNVRLPWMHLGSINNDRFLSMIYSAADVFVISSLQDNLPNTVLEAMACGTPIIGVGVGGIAEMVRNGLNGVTVPRADAGALSAAVRDLLDGAAQRQEMKVTCRRIALEEYPLELQARRYLKIYESLL